MDNRRLPKYIIVSGPPGAGKTTLARPLAKVLGFPLLTKDDFKETLYDQLHGEPGDLEFSRKIGGIAMELLWNMASHCPQAVLEANFRPNSEYQRTRIRALGENVIEIYCRCDLDEVARRFAERAKSADHHPAHFWSEIEPDELKQYDQPINIGSIIEVNTGAKVDINTIVATILTTWATARM